MFITVKTFKGERVCMYESEVTPRVGEKIQVHHRKQTVGVYQILEVYHHVENNPAVNGVSQALLTLVVKDV